MKQYLSEDRAIYEDLYHGQFSRKLARWAIDRMMVKDTATGRMKPITPVMADDVEDILANNGINLPQECIYTAWYLYNMTLAVYPKTLTTDAQRASYVAETILDPDGDTTNPLACFEAKMCNVGIPVYWERMV